MPKALQRLVEVAILGGDPCLGSGSRAEEVTPAASTGTLVEREAKADGVQPGSRIGPIESVPGAIRTQVGLLCQIQRRLAVAYHGRQAPDEPGKC